MTNMAGKCRSRIVLWGVAHSFVNLPKLSFKELKQELAVPNLLKTVFLYING